MYFKVWLWSMDTLLVPITGQALAGRELGERARGESQRNRRKMGERNIYEERKRGCLI